MIDASVIGVKNRSKRARERAGLSIGQAAELLGVSRDDLIAIEESDSKYADANRNRMCDVYAVNLDWLSGDADLHDYAAVDRMRGANDLTPHDRGVIAEFAASMPRRESTDQRVELQARVDIHGAEANCAIAAVGNGRYTRDNAAKRAAMPGAQSSTSVITGEPGNCYCYGCGRLLTNDDIEIALCNACEKARSK